MRSRWSAVLALGAAFLMAGCGRRQPNVLIVVMDACRPDKMGCYGFENPTSPEIDRLAADPDGVVFERHYVQGNWTKPSTASLFSGLYVYQHRLTMDEAASEPTRWRPYLHPQIRTMAEVFQEAGYFTWGLGSIPHLDPRFGFGQGFDHYTLHPAGDELLSEEVLRLARESDGPFFGYVHFIACHFPYWHRLRGREYMAEYGTPYAEKERVAAGIDFTSPKLDGAIQEGRVTLDAADVRFLNEIYESTLASFDERVIGPLLQGLRDSGLYDDTLIVLTADHGEELYDHRGYSHGHALWDEVINVPLIVKFPRQRRPAGIGPRWSGLSRAIDLYPTLTASVGLKAPQGLPGRNLIDEGAPAMAFSEAGGIWAGIRGDEKLIFRVRQAPQYFDLSTDPTESRNLASDHGDAVVELRRQVQTLRRAYPPPALEPYDWEAEPLAPEAVELLKSLGYVD